MSIKQRITSAYRYIEPNLFFIGLFGCLGFPAYYLIWAYVFPQPYENLPLRLVCAALFLPFAIKSYLPSLFSRYKEKHFVFTICFCLPFFFCYMMIRNEWSVEWIMSFMAAIFLSIIIIYDWLIILICTTIAACSAALLGYLSMDNIGIGFHYSYLIVFSFSYFTGICFNYRNRIEIESKQLFSRSFSNGIAHEMRNPLSALYASQEVLLELLPETLTDDPQQHRLISNAEIHKLRNIIQDNISVINNGHSTINLLLNSIDSQKISPHSFQYLSINDVIIDALNVYGYQQKSDRQLVTYQINKDNLFFGNDILLRYVIFNLLKNSFYYKDKPNFKIVISVYSKNNETIISVKDYGKGIPLTAIKNIFTEYYTSGKKNNSGLGLSFCKKVITAFAGNIECYSTENISTTFIIRLPNVTSSVVEKMQFDLMCSKKILFLGYHNQLLSDMNHLAFFYNFTLLYKKTSSYDVTDINTNNYDCIIIDIDSIQNELLTKLYNHIATTAIKVILISHSNSAKEIVLSKTYQPYLFKYNHIDELQKKLITQIFTHKTPVNDGFITTNVNKAKVMLVDDNVSLRLYSGILLKNAGYDVIEADNGRTALSYLEESTVDLILMDSQMPVMSGIDATKEIRTNHLYSLHQNTPIICYSGSLDAEHREHLTNIGITDFLLKPSSKTTLLDIVHKWIDA
ncbi:hybrid sensor histidine kinase/response regulator [Photobacterium piscicola]|uniref:hybrid sensor histidine kinase/response regulator n=1 Tax=Photobacterium piscicola TaxID=1378299 RepID=UPI002E16B604|nr:hybrid sensor histidine kinase/response regulator [Photobacterium piscicola]MEC6881733.1 hybrid sensor histidine kinase/response regulator [Photobacterium piscicola]